MKAGGRGGRGGEGRYTETEQYRTPYSGRHSSEESQHFQPERDSDTFNQQQEREEREERGEMLFLRPP